MSKAEQNCQTHCEPIYRKKSSDLRRCLKTVNDVDEVTLDGRLFHTRDGATGDAVMCRISDFRFQFLIGCHYKNPNLAVEKAECMIEY